MENKVIIELLTEISGNLAKIAGLLEGGSTPESAETNAAPVIDIANLLNAKQAISQLGISERTLYRNSGKDKLIQPIRILGSNYYDPKNIEKVMRYFMK